MADSIVLLSTACVSLAVVGGERLTMMSRTGSSAVPAMLSRGPRRVRLTARGGSFFGVAGLALVAAYVAGWPELLVVACFAVVPPVIALVLVARENSELQIVRVISPRVLSARSVGVVRLIVRNRRARASAAGEWWDRLPWAPGVSEVGPLPALAPDRTIELRYGLVPPQRGVVDVGTFVVRFTDSFALATIECEFGRLERVVVAPETVQLAAGVVEIAADSGSARMFQHRALAGEHDVMTREYRSGDALRRVHWKASAHHGELMVREDERRSHASAIVLVETRSKRFPDVVGARTRNPHSEQFEWSLSMVASLRDHLVASGLAVNVVESTQPQLAEARATHDFIESLARAGLSFDDYRRPRWRDDPSRELGSVFAVLGVPDAPLVNDLAESRALFDSAIAFVSQETPDAAITTLRTSGWSVVRVAPDDSVSDAWLRVGLDD